MKLQAAGKIDPFGKPPLLAGNLRETIEHVRIGRILAQHLRVAVLGLGQRALPVERNGVLEQGCGRGLQDAILVLRPAEAARPVYRH